MASSTSAYPSIGPPTLRRERVNALPETAVVRNWKQFYLQNAVKLELDGNGRIVVPTRLRTWCQLGDKVAFVGLDEHRFELWRPADFDQDDDLFVEDWERMRDQLAELGL